MNVTALKERTQTKSLSPSRGEPVASAVRVYIFRCSVNLRFSLLQPGDRRW